MQNLLDSLKMALKPDASFFAGDDLLKNVVIERALRMDPGLIGLLAASAPIRSHFFTEVEGVLVFDKVAFQRFVSNKAFLPDSYTAFRNRIGLMHGDDYLKQSQDVVLAWPFKDCVLEGGMTREDRGRQEVFWNETLAPDDISRLFEPKVLTNFQRWDVEAVEAGTPKPVDEISMDDNLLIKGNNLLALHTLKARYAGKVKLIYIDPPYNTGNDGFRYNDRFNHASWLTFMRNRLEVARELLRDDGAIFVNLDDGEAHYCKVLMDEIFGRDRFVANVVWQSKDTPGNNSTSLSETHNHILVYGKQEKWKPKLLERTPEQIANYKNPDNDPRGPWLGTPLTRAEYRERDSYPLRNAAGRMVPPPEGSSWRRPPEAMKELQESNLIYWGIDGNSSFPMEKKFLSDAKDGVTAQTWWPYKFAGSTRNAGAEMKALGCAAAIKVRLSVNQDETLRRGCDEGRA